MNRSSASDRMALIEGERAVERLKAHVLFEWEQTAPTGQRKPVALLTYIGNALEERLAEALGELRVLRERVEEADGKVVDLEREARYIAEKIECYEIGEKEALSELDKVRTGLAEDLDSETVTERFDSAQHAGEGRVAERLVALIGSLVNYHRGCADALKCRVAELEDELAQLRETPRSEPTPPHAPRQKRQPVGSDTIPLPFPSSYATAPQDTSP